MFLSHFSLIELIALSKRTIIPKSLVGIAYKEDLESCLVRTKIIQVFNSPKIDSNFISNRWRAFTSQKKKNTCYQMESKYFDK